MRISDAVGFLVLTREGPSSPQRVCIQADMNAAVGAWEAATRISPMYQVRRGSNPNPVLSTAANWEILLLGPIPPQRISEFDRDDVSIWVTLGAFNVVVASEMSGGCSEVKIWAEQNRIRGEFWTVRNGTLESTAFLRAESRLSETTAAIRDLAGFVADQALSDPITEYKPLMASALSRCSVVTPAVLDDLLLANRMLMAILLSDDHDSDHVARAGILTTVNAALSRYSSQAYSGMSPIAETECHFWNHSLLGTAVANLALIAIRRQLERDLGELRIPQRLEKLGAARGTTVPSLTDLHGRDKHWYTDKIGPIRLTSKQLNEPIFPLVTYLSGRDGFKSTTNTLSAGTNVISSCNSMRWSLLTITHETCHTIIRAILGALLPDVENSEDLSSAMELLNQERGETLFDEIRRYLLLEILHLEGFYTNAPVRYSVDALALAIDHYYTDIEELMVHVFDFLYFYSADPEAYIKGIWTSWGVIPYISNRIPEYVLRTLCAISVNHLRRVESTPDLAYEQTLKYLKETASDRSNKFARQAVAHLEREWNLTIKNTLKAHLPITQIVRSYLYSSTLARTLQREEYVASRSASHLGYDFTPKEIITREITNPLKFIRAYTRSAKVSPAYSAWMLITLAFNSARNADRH